MMHRPLQETRHLRQQRLDELHQQLRYAQTEYDRQTLRTQIEFYRRLN